MEKDRNVKYKSPKFSDIKRSFRNTRTRYHTKAALIKRERMAIKVIICLLVLPFVALAPAGSLE